MSNDKGTPKTLTQAIQNGISQFHDPKAHPNSIEGMEACIEQHVRDYLAQKFGAAMLENESADSILQAVFNRIVEKK